MESRVLRELQARFGGEYLETDRSNVARRWVLSLPGHNGQHDTIRFPHGNRTGDQ